MPSTQPSSKKLKRVFPYFNPVRDASPSDHRYDFSDPQVSAPYTLEYDCSDLLPLDSSILLASPSELGIAEARDWTRIVKKGREHYLQHLEFLYDEQTRLEAEVRCILYKIVEPKSLEGVLSCSKVLLWRWEHHPWWKERIRLELVREDFRPVPSPHTSRGWGYWIEILIDCGGTRMMT